MINKMINIMMTNIMMINNIMTNNIMINIIYYKIRTQIDNYISVFI